MAELSIVNKDKHYNGIMLSDCNNNNTKKALKRKIEKCNMCLDNTSLSMQSTSCVHHNLSNEEIVKKRRKRTRMLKNLKCIFPRWRRKKRRKTRSKSK